MDDRLQKKERKHAISMIAKWFYQARIHFNTTRLRSFHAMVNAIGNFGRGLKLPYHELRETLLKEEVKALFSLIIFVK